MLRTIERRRAILTLHGWAISVLKEAGAIRECEEHGWMQDRADPHARERAFDIARRRLFAGRRDRDRGSARLDRRYLSGVPGRIGPQPDFAAQVIVSSRT